jgi:hypothetical protein
MRDRTDWFRAAEHFERTAMTPRMVFFQACLGLMKRIWRNICATPQVTHLQSPVGVAVVPVPAAAPVAAAQSPALAPLVTAVDDNTLAEVVAHLEFLRYSVSHQPDGWSFAEQPDRRYGFSVRVFPRGIRLHCQVGIRPSIWNSRQAWLEFLNEANNRGLVTRFSLTEVNGRTFVRMRALITGGYHRTTFGMVIDMWHDDLDIIMRKPEFVEESSEDVEEAMTATVN